MNSLKTRLLFFALVLCGMTLSAQKSMRDSSITFPYVGILYGGAIPGGDLADRFGWSNMIGPEVGIKLKSNWYVQGSCRFLFGNRVRERIAENITEPIGSPEQGYSMMALGNDGRYYQVRFWERGVVVPVIAGKLFHLLGHNDNSGFYLEAGGQFIQHRVRVEAVGDAVPGLSEDYRKGYDRMTLGVGLVEGFGYRLHSSSSLTNFIIGVEASQNWTQGMRSYQYDTGAPGDAKRLDLLWGFKLAWIFPIYQSAPEDY